VKRTNNDLTTPPELVDVLHRFGTLALDPCSNPWSEVDALIRLSRHAGDDGLRAQWARLVRALSLEYSDPFAYVNPPYGHGPPPPGRKRGAPLMPAWARKIVLEASRGLETIALAPHDQSTDWWRVMRKPAAARIDFDKRIKFGGGRGQGKIRSALFYYGPRRYLFAHHFERFGELTL
jgi:hypothetical protein